MSKLLDLKYKDIVESLNISVTTVEAPISKTVNKSPLKFKNLKF